MEGTTTKLRAILDEDYEKADSAAIFMTARRRPRVLHLITSFEVGGTERQAVELLKRLDSDRIEARLAVIRNRGPLYQEIAARFPDVQEFPLTSFYNRNAIKQLARLRAFLRNERIDLLHAHDFYSGLIGAAAARLSGVRIIACQRHIRLSDRRVHKWGTRLIHRLAHKVLVNSVAIRDAILAEGAASPNKIVVIENGLCPAAGEERNELRRELGLNSEAKIVGMVARLQPVKGHRYFIEAASRLSREIANLHFVLIGDGPLAGEIKDQALRLGIDDRVYLLGERTDAARLVAAFDVAVLASLHEGLPNAVMEAMAAGVVVVATAVGGVTELIADRETGYLVPSADAAALAGCIKFALSEEQRSKAVASRGRQFILSRFGIERMVESVERLYDELIAN